ncbi:hypothetical protein RHSIM_Rhsim05G0030100 [Rhododendron simsii]|uniref:40S ribosomal protein S30 n=1 Tax=Rhododendron simsii TaxID=118357 RepID=A0A834H0F1_RHOSS|nr:hypothetical protein RHSIM_Rhsim05G0030100 [Rhododendron simsii]
MMSATKFISLLTDLAIGILKFGKPKKPTANPFSQTRESTMGKVHGSLARAGKVRGQTPKVAKQDKKKKPRGRAHKRMQYNRLVGFGKKRGPNSSEK